MIQSMTGFGSTDKDGYKVEIRSINSKWLDISIRALSFMASYEIFIRNLIKNKFKRGKFDITISLSYKIQPALRIDKKLAKDMYKTFNDLKNDLKLSGNLDINFFANYRDIIIAENTKFNKELLDSATNKSLEKVEEMRKKEGENLSNYLSEYSKKIEQFCFKIERVFQRSSDALYKKISDKIQYLTESVKIDDTKLAQGIALIIQKNDISEEISRMKSHIGQFQKTLSSKSDTLGKKMDFIAQEINREANTISSKVDNIDIVNYVINIKDYVEKIREQVQNIQ